MRPRQPTSPFTWKWILTLVGSGCADGEFRVRVPEGNAVADRIGQKTDDARRRLECRAVILNQITV